MTKQQLRLMTRGRYFWERLAVSLIIVLLGFEVLIMQIDLETKHYNAIFAQQIAGLNLTCDDFEHDIATWQDYEETKAEYIEALALNMEDFDKTAYTLGRMYDKDYTQISRTMEEIGVPEDEQYNFYPEQDPNFIEATSQNESGIWITDSKVGKISIYYRWIPASDTEFLMAIGISERVLLQVPLWLSISYLILICIGAFIPILHIIKDQRIED